MRIGNILMIALLLVLLSSLSCRHAGCGNGTSCATGGGSLTFTACGQQYTFNCFEGPTAIDASHYLMTFSSCNDPSCTFKILFANPCVVNISSLPITLNSTNTSGAYIEIITNCPAADTGSTTTGLSVTFSSFTGGILTGTVSGTINNSVTGSSCTIQNGTFSLQVPTTVFNCNTTYYPCGTHGFIKMTINGIIYNFNCFVASTPVGNDLDVVYDIDSMNTPICGIGLQFFGANLLSAGLVMDSLQGLNGNLPYAQFAFVQNCRVGTDAAYDGVTQAPTVVTITSIDTGMIAGTITGDCCLVVSGNNLTRYPIVNGSFVVPDPF